MSIEQLVEHEFTAADDGIHDSAGEFYDTETFWFSFFVPQRNLGGWVYTSLRPGPGVCAGGMWIWDASAVEPWQLPFFENFSWLKFPTQRGPQHLDFANGMSIRVREPLTSYDVLFSDRNRAEVSLRFNALEAPVALRSGAPPYPQAHHFDQTGHVVGTIVLDGERIEVDSYAMRDRSWGKRTERGYSRVGYSWGAAEDVSFLTYSIPSGDDDDIHTGYLRVGTDVAYLTGGHRIVERDPHQGWVTGMRIEATDEAGRTLHAVGRAASRMVLPGSSSICVNTLMEWTLDGRTVHGEDQDVWPLDAFRRSLTR